VSFDFELIGHLIPPPATLNAVMFGEDIVLHWSNPAYHLEESDQLGTAANWQGVADATSPVSVAPSAAQKFYRLKK